MPVEELAATTVRAVVQKSGIDPARIDDVVFAQSYANSEVPCVGRWAALQAGLPVEVPGMQLDRRCGGGLQAIVTAAMMVQSGAADVVIAGGVESMSNIEYYTTDMRWGARSGNVRFFDRLDRGRERSQPVERFGRISGMIETAENLARDYGISREQADAFAVRSHARAAAAWEAGRFADEIVPVGAAAQGRPRRLHARRGLPPRYLAGQPGQAARIDAGRHRHRRQRQPAERCLRRLPDRGRGQLAELGLTPMATLVGWAAAGCEPSHMGIGPVPAVKKLLARLNLTLEQMGMVELNEAFACQVLAVLKGWDWHDRDAIEHKLNVNGSGISLGHPIGATGVRILATLLHELQRRGGRYGLETMCIGGGQGIAAVFERC